MRRAISAKLSFWPAVMGTRVGGLDVKLGVGGNMGAAGGLPVGGCSLLGTCAEVPLMPTRRGVRNLFCDTFAAVRIFEGA